MREAPFYSWGELHLHDVCYEEKEDIYFVLKKEGEKSFEKICFKKFTF